jgi:hypothetical protein
MALRLADCRVLVAPKHFSHVRATKAALYYASLSQKNLALFTNFWSIKVTDHLLILSLPHHSPLHFFLLIHNKLNLYTFLIFCFSFLSPSPILLFFFHFYILLVPFTVNLLKRVGRLA